MNNEPAEAVPASVEQITAALIALGAYNGANTPTGHAQEAARVGGEDVYRIRLLNALLGVVQGQAMSADSRPLDDDAKIGAWDEQYHVIGAGENDLARMIAFMQWQVLRAAMPVRRSAQHPETGPIPIAAAHAFDAVQMLLGVVAASRDAAATGDVDTLTAQADRLRDARVSLENTIGNIDALLNMLDSVDL
ncbi:DUF6245 family protein [Embleya sp. NPDC050493]|uniref:DUF6245 family protein n=1 Tax=Embleya sp. NPDC050493 TaxID=3363989 RepID=UPI0037B648AE